MFNGKNYLVFVSSFSRQAKKLFSMQRQTIFHSVMKTTNLTVLKMVLSIMPTILQTNIMTHMAMK